jgi:hypothetical protein
MPFGWEILQARAAQGIYITEEWEKPRSDVEKAGLNRGRCVSAIANFTRFLFVK